MTTPDLPTLPTIAHELGISYAMLRRWYHAGTITLDTPPAGSGNRGHVHPAEAAAIADTIHQARQLATLQTELRHGAYYRTRLAHHLAAGRVSE